MAIDTAAKRFSMMDFDLPYQPGMGPPDAAILEGDRLALLWLYSGLAAAPPVIITIRRRIRNIRARQSINNIWSP